MAARLDSAPNYKDYGNPAVDVDLFAEGGAACRMIRPLGTGTLVVETPAGVQRSIAVTQNVDEPIQAVRVDSDTDIAFRAYW